MRLTVAGRVLPIVAACDPVNLCYLHQAPIGQQRTVDTVVKIGDNFRSDRPHRTVTDTALTTLKVSA